MIAYIKSISIETGTAKVTLTTADTGAIPALLELIGEKLDVEFRSVQMRLPMDTTAAVRDLLSDR